MKCFECGKRRKKEKCWICKGTKIHWERPCVPCEGTGIAHKCYNPKCECYCLRPLFDVLIRMPLRYEPLDAFGPDAVQGRGKIKCANQ